MYMLYIANKNYSSWSLRPWVLMRELGIRFDGAAVPFGRARTRALPRLLAHGQGAVPARWRHRRVGFAGDRRIPGRTPRRRLAGAMTHARAWARSAAAEMHSGFGALRHRASMNCGVRVQAEGVPRGPARRLRAPRGAVERGPGPFRRTLPGRGSVQRRGRLLRAGGVSRADLRPAARRARGGLRRAPARVAGDARLVRRGARRTLARRAARSRASRQQGRYRRIVSGTRR